MTDIEMAEAVADRVTVMKEGFRIGKESVLTYQNNMEMRALLDACDPKDREAGIYMYEYAQMLNHPSTLDEVNARRGYA